MKIDVDELIKKLNTISSFKNVTASYNENKNIYDVYARIKGDEKNDYINTKDALDRIDGLDYVYCDFGLFELWFTPEDSRKVVNKLCKEF